MRISVITCVKSDTQDLIETWKSIKPFIGIELDWIIKFGHECSDSFTESIPNQSGVIKVLSRDYSLYDGLNQALERCETDLYFVLGAGDIVSGDFLNAKIEIKNNPNQSAYFFACRLMKSNSVLLPNYSELNVRMACPHPGAVLRAEYSRSIGGFFAAYQIAADYDHLCRYVKKYESPYQSTSILSEFMGGGLSDQRAFEGMLEEELIRIRIHQSNPFGVYGRLLRSVANPIVSLLDANFK